MDPWQIIVDTHGAAHEYESPDIVQAAGYFIPLIHLHQPVIYAVFFQEVGEIAGAFDIYMTENKERFHQFRMQSMGLWDYTAGILRLPHVFFYQCISGMIMDRFKIL